MKRLAALVALLLVSWPCHAQVTEMASADGWFRWHIVDSNSAGKSLYVRKQRDRLVSIFIADGNCGYTRREKAIDLGEMSTDDAVSMLLDIVMDDDLDKTVREQALFGLAQSDSDRAFDALDRIIFGG